MVINKIIITLNTEYNQINIQKQINYSNLKKHIGEWDFWSSDYRIIFNGDDRRITGVGFILNREIKKNVVEMV
jgi:hypothetical protein